MNGFLKTLSSTAVLAVCLFVLAGMQTTAFARIAQETIIVDFNNISFAVDGRRVNTEFEPFIFQGRTYLPVRDVAGAMGFHVDWDGAASTVILTSGADAPQRTVSAPGRVARETIVVNFNNIGVTVNGTRVNTEYEPFIFQGRTYLPVRDVANMAGFDVTWEAATNTVHLTSRTGVAPDYPPHQPQPGTPPAGDWRGPGRAPANWPASVNITPERAVEIALARVGGGTVREVDHDFERGRAAWWIEIRHGGRVYEVKVDVQTGAIVDFERD